MLTIILYLNELCLYKVQLQHMTEILKLILQIKIIAAVIEKCAQLVGSVTSQFYEVGMHNLW